MRFKGIMACAAAALALSACGQQDEASKKPNKAEDAQKAEAASELPEMVVAKVPLDENGNELLDQASVRGVNGDVEGGEQAEAKFNGGNEINATANAKELDKDASSPQWHFKRNRFNRFNRYNRYSRFNRFRSSYRSYYRGYSYRYNYRSYYRGNNCRYYTYRRYY